MVQCAGQMSLMDLYAPLIAANEPPILLTEGQTLYKVVRGDIEMDIVTVFICYEIKSCKEDVFSGNGLNFYGEKNYIVTTMQCYKDILPDLRDRTFKDHLRTTNPDSSLYFGIMVAVPYGREQYEEFEKPTPISKDLKWRLEIIKPCNIGSRKKSLTELLFCMVRSGH